MASAFGSSTTSWGTGSYSMPKARAPLASYKAPHKPSGIFGHLEEIAGNLLGDIKDAAVGIPMGLVTLAEHPIRSVEAMGKAEWATYSPLFHGHVGEFLHGLEEHPLQPILDIATIVTLGGAAAGTVGTSAAKGLAAAGSTGRVTEALANVGGKTVSESGQVVSRMPINLIEQSKLFKRSGVPEDFQHIVPVHPNPVIRMRQSVTRKAADAVAEHVPGSTIRWEAGSLKATGAAKYVGPARRFKKDIGRTSANRGAAVGTLHRKFLKEALRIKGMTGAQIWDKLSPHFKESMDRHEMYISEKQLRIKADGSRGVAAGFQFRRDPTLDRRNYKPTDNTPDEMSKAFDKWKQDEFTNDISEAKYVVDPKTGTRKYATARSADKMVQEADNAYRAIHMIHSKPMQVWKWFVLAASPRFFVNNVVGNMLMYVAATNPKASLMGIAHTVQQTMSQRAFERAATGADRAVRRQAGDFYDQYLGGQLSGFAEHELSTAKTGANPYQGKARVKRIVKGGLYPLTHLVSDTFVRRSTANWAVKRMPSYQLEFQQLRANGVGYFESHNLAAKKALANSSEREYVIQAMDNVLGDYNYLNKAERAVKNVVPFYTWDRAIMRHTKDLAFNRPYEAAMMAGIGKQGVEETQKALGQLPEFLKGSIPLGSHTSGILGWILGVSTGGRTRILTTQGLNPYSTVPDVMSAVGALGGVGKLSAGETVGSQISPFLAGGIEAITGTSLLSGAPIDKAPGGVVGSIFSHVGTSLPQYRLLDSLRKGAQPGDDPARPKLFTSDFRQQFSGFLGAPMKDVSKESMATIYAREHPANRQFRKSTASRSLFQPPQQAGF